MRSAKGDDDVEDYNEGDNNKGDGNNDDDDADNSDDDNDTHSYDDNDEGEDDDGSRTAACIHKDDDDSGPGSHPKGGARLNSIVPRRFSTPAQS